MICENPLSVATWRFAAISLFGSSKFMMRTQNIHVPSSRLNAVAPFVNAYPRSGVTVIWGDVGVAFAI
ncbi:hypothetical protein LMG28690_02952 [Paraburkholderia caffeinilytica]|nr:hypothetical protein LMG28690_02952 [Paraburkholderia caffeinilytica]